MEPIFNPSILFRIPSTTIIGASNPHKNLPSTFKYSHGTGKNPL